MSMYTLLNNKSPLLNDDVIVEEKNSLIIKRHIKWEVESKWQSTFSEWNIIYRFLLRPLLFHSLYVNYIQCHDK